MPQRLIAAVEDDRSVEERADREHWDIAICRFLTGVATARVVPASLSASQSTRTTSASTCGGPWRLSGLHPGTRSVNWSEAREAWSFRSDTEGAAGWWQGRAGCCHSYNLLRQRGCRSDESAARSPGTCHSIWDTGRPLARGLPLRLVCPGAGPFPATAGPNHAGQFPGT